MKNVRWTTALYTAVSAASILLAIAGVYYGLKGDIKDTRTETKELFVAVNHKLDSIQHDNTIEFKNIWNELGRQKNSGSWVTEYKSPDGKLHLKAVN